MAIVSITEAAKLAGISRTHFYRSYIKTGKISISKNEKDKPVIDTSELLRVFNTLQVKQQEVTYVTDTGKPMLQGNNTNETVLFERIRGLEALLKAREEELEGYKEREKNLYQKLIENKTGKKKRLWFF